MALLWNVSLAVCGIWEHCEGAYLGCVYQGVGANSNGCAAVLRMVLTQAKKRTMRTIFTAMPECDGLNSAGVYRYLSAAGGRYDNIV